MLIIITPVIFRPLNIIELGTDEDDVADAEEEESNAVDKSDTAGGWRARRH